MILDEGYHLMMRDGIYFTQGKHINRKYAVCQTPQKTYTVTHIETGTKISAEYENIETAYERSRQAIKEKEKRIRDNPEVYKEKTEHYKSLFDAWIKEKRIIDK